MVEVERWVDQKLEYYQVPVVAQRRAKRMKERTVYLIEAEPEKEIVYVPIMEKEMPVPEVEVEVEVPPEPEEEVEDAVVEDDVAPGTAMHGFVDYKFEQTTTNEWKAKLVIKNKAMSDRIVTKKQVTEEKWMAINMVTDLLSWEDEVRHLKHQVIGFGTSATSGSEEYRRHGHMSSMGLRTSAMNDRGDYKTQGEGQHQWIWQSAFSGIDHNYARVDDKFMMVYGSAYYGKDSYENERKVSHAQVDSLATHGEEIYKRTDSDTHRFHTPTAMSGYDVYRGVITDGFQTVWNHAMSDKIAGYTMHSYALGKFQLATSAFFRDYWHKENEHIVIRPRAMSE